VNLQSPKRRDVCVDLQKSNPGMTANENAEVTPSKKLFDLPSYCYDMHTRVGLNVLQRLVRSVPGAEGIKQFFPKIGSEMPTEH
jgi:hypothetical protein